MTAPTQRDNPEIAAKISSPMPAIENIVRNSIVKVSLNVFSQQDALT